MKNRKRRDYLGLLLLLVVGLSVGFALLQANLTINGSSKIKGSSWDIHFENLNVTEGSVLLSDGDSAATIQSGATNVSFTVTLNKPGDFYEFTVDAVNAGSIDGMVESVTSKLNNVPITTLPNHLKYSVTYETNDKIQVNHLLKAGKRETYKVRIEFKKDISSSDLPTTVQTLTLEFRVVYVQADSNGVEVDHRLNGIVYTVNKFDEDATNPKNNLVWLNQEYPIIIPYFETAEEALSTIATASNKDSPFYIKHKVENGIVTESYVEFVVTEAMAHSYPEMTPGTYTLRGEKTYDRDTSTWLVDENYISPYYESNKEIIKTAFGNTGLCRETGTGRSIYFICGNSGMDARARSSGTVASYSAEYGSNCSVVGDGSSYCDWS